MIIKANINLARKEALRILKRHFYSSYVPVEKIAKLEGITVTFLPLDDSLSGMAFIKNDVKNIVVNAGHHPNRQRFTIGHELGHHIMHHEQLAEGVHVDTVIMRRDHQSSTGESLREQEANAFSAALLMPDILLEEYKDVDLSDDHQLKEIAKRLKVSLAALQFRLLNW